MDRLGSERERADDEGRPEEKIWRAGARMGELITQAIAAIIVLGIFTGLVYLRLQGQLGDDGLLVFAGVIIGYLLHSIKDII